MSINYYIPRPTVAASVQWDGGNFSEVEQVIGETYVVNNGDGTITVTAPDGSGTFLLETGQWAADTWRAYTEDPLAARGLQPVPGGGPLTYTVS